MAVNQNGHRFRHSAIARQARSYTGAGLSGDSFLVQTSIVGASFSALAALPISVHLKIT